MKWIIFGVIVGCVAFPAAADEPPKPADFAYSMTLTTDGMGALYEVTLPAAVYRRLTRHDAGDLRVFNAGGEVIPHGLRRPKVTEVVPERVSLTPFPVYTSSGEIVGGTTLNVRKDRSGQVIHIETRESGKADRKLAALVFDTEKLKQPVRALELEWAQAPKEFVGQMTLEASDDLTHWRMLARASVVHLTYAGQQLERRRIEFAPHKANYLRLTWPARQETPEVKHAMLELAGDAPVPVRHWTALSAEGPGEKQGEYVFTLPGRVPADRARLMLAQTNSLVRVELLARENSSAKWVRYADGPVYRLAIGMESLESPELCMTTAPAPRHWLLRVTPPDGLGANPPILELGWVPHDLLFAAQGAGPYQLAYGAAGVGPVNFPMPALLAEIEKQDKNTLIRKAEVGPETVLGGEGRLARQSDWKKIALWAALVAAVGLLAWMARRLMTQLRSSQ